MIPQFIIYTLIIAHLAICTNSLHPTEEEEEEEELVFDPKSANVQCITYQI